MAVFLYGQELASTLRVNMTAHNWQMYSVTQAKRYFLIVNALKISSGIEDFFPRLFFFNPAEGFDYPGRKLWEVSVSRERIPEWAGGTEYWMIYRRPGFLAVAWFASRPPLSSASCISFSVFLCVPDRAWGGGGGGGMGVDPNHTTARKPGPLNIIQYFLAGGFNRKWGEAGGAGGGTSQTKHVLVEKWRKFWHCTRKNRKLTVRYSTGAHWCIYLLLVAYFT